jgi:hypothetical protein
MACSLPKWDLFDAVFFMTGKQHRPPPNEAWTRAAQWLDARGYTGMEYVTYLTQYSELKHKKTAALRLTNWVTHQGTLDKFQTWKDGRPKKVQRLAMHQTKKFFEYLDQGFSPKRVFMENLAEVSAPVMAELALRWRDEGDRGLWKDVLDKCANQAYLWLLGCPEYLGFCPRVQRDLEKGEESELRRSITEAGGSTALT